MFDREHLMNSPWTRFFTAVELDISGSLSFFLTFPEFDKYLI